MYTASRTHKFKDVDADVECILAKGFFLYVDVASLALNKCGAFTCMLWVEEQ